MAEQIPKYLPGWRLWNAMGMKMINFKYDICHELKERCFELYATPNPFLSNKLWLKQVMSDLHEKYYPDWLSLSASSHRFNWTVNHQTLTKINRREWQLCELEQNTTSLLVSCEWTWRKLWMDEVKYVPQTDLWKYVTQTQFLRRKNVKKLSRCQVK